MNDYLQNKNVFSSHSLQRSAVAKKDVIM